MKHRIVLSLALVVAAAVAVGAVGVGCDKGGGGAKGSGTLGADDKAMFASLPAGQQALFGGNYMKLQNFMQSGLGQASSALMKNVSPGMNDWMGCFSDMKDMKVAATVGIAGKDATMRMVMTGVTIPQLQACAAKASFKVTVDPDNKYIAIEIPVMGNSTTTGYLQLPSGALYSRTGMALSLVPTPIPSSRADLEADIAALKGKPTAADDAAMQDLVAKVDRTKTVWIVGNGAGTPIADKIGEVWGAIDMTSGLAIDVTIQVKNKADADKLADGIEQLRKMADQVPGDFKDVIKNLQFNRDGDHLHFGVKISDAALKSMMSQFGGMLGGGLGGGGM